jgi:hypothetical protein
MNTATATIMAELTASFSPTARNTTLAVVSTDTTSPDDRPGGIVPSMFSPAGDVPIAPDSGIPDGIVPGGIITGNKFPLWLAILIAGVVLSFVGGFGMFAYHKFITRDKEPDIEQGATPADQDKVPHPRVPFMARLIATVDSLHPWKKSVSPPGSLQPTTGIALNNFPPISLISPLPASLQYAHGRNAAHFANFRAKNRGRDDAFGQATQKAIDHIQGQATYERNANPFHPR